LYRVSKELSAALDSGRNVVVPTLQSAQTLRLAHSALQLRAGLRVWRSPLVLPWSSWLDRLLRAAALADTALAGYRVLSTAQERLMWQDATLEAGGPAELAARVQRSAALLSEQHLAAVPGLLGDALAAFRAACVQRRFISLTFATQAQLRSAAAGLDAPVTLAGFAELTPRQRSLFELLDADSVPQAAERPVVRIASASEFAAEVDLAAAWSRTLLTEDPGRRLLVVTPDIARDRPLLARRFTATLLPRQLLLTRDWASPQCAVLRFERGPALATRPPIEQALLVLSLRPQAAELEQLTAILHAPFLGADAERIHLDLWLRGLGRARFEHDELERALLQAPEGLTTVAASLAQALCRQRELLAPPGLTLREWAERFGAVVDGYGWPGATAMNGLGHTQIARWRELLGELAGLEAIVSGRDRGCDEALALLTTLVDSEASVPLCDAAITFMDRADLIERRQAPIVGYDGIWILGMDASRWPLAARPDPLLPLAAQRLAGLPQASVGGRMQQARTALDHWTRAAGQVVLSWSSAQGELRQQMSPLLAECVDARPYESPAIVTSLAQRIAATRALERVADLRGRQWNAGELLPGGVRVLELQGDCAFRAYAQLRLAAEPLETAQAGLDPRLRGLLLHRCLELLWGELQGSETLARRSEPQLRRSIGVAFERALGEASARQVLAPDARLLERERRRTINVLLDLFALERQREAFVVQAVEQRGQLRVDGVTLRLRIDRVDRLQDDGLLVFDYKSGTAGRLELFAERAAPAQLLAYASVLANEYVAGLALVQLRRPVRFVAVADRDERLPRLRGSPDNWDQQRERWRGYVEQLVRDFVAGHAAVNPRPQACQYCHLPALCRIDSLRIQDEAPLEDVNAAGGHDGAQDE
jgi:ATP-dependent helicase/nuclease subunit B